MITLAVDTSQRVGSVAVARDGRAAAHARMGAEASHLAEISRRVDEALTGAGVGLADIDRVALVIGPGSFTGLRIGLAFVKGLHAGTGVDVCTIGTLELIARGHLDAARPVCVMLDARRGEVYAAVYSAGESPDAAPRELLSPRAVTPDELLHVLPQSPGLVVGSGCARYRDKVESLGCDVVPDGDGALPSTKLLAELAPQLPVLSHDDVRRLEPVYLRESEAVRKKLGPVEPNE